MTHPIREELESLLLQWELGIVTDEELERLREILRSDPLARRHYLHWQTITAALHAESESGLRAASEWDSTEIVLDQEESTESNDSAGRLNRIRTISDETSGAGESRYWRWFAAAAALLVCLLSARLLYVESNDSPMSANRIAASDTAPGEIPEATSSGVAFLAHLVDVQWADDQSPLSVGDALDPGRLAIESGFAQIEFFCGATVILEGPAEIELTSSTLASVKHGRLRAQVPPAARGFSLDVDEMRVVDLGTEFGLSVTDQGAEVQVFDGEVELERNDAAKKKLLAGQAVLHSKGKYQDASVTPDQFLDIESLESRADGQRAARFRRWREWSDKTKRDDRMIAYYAFDGVDSWKRKLLATASSIDGMDVSELDGAIVGARRLPGRWIEKGALEFKRPADRVRVNLPGQYQAISLACWAKIDSLDRKFNSLFLTDGYDAGEPHWQILETGQMYFSVRPDDLASGKPRDFKALSPEFWVPSLSGKWIHLATTFDLASGEITHYLNGQMLSRHSVPAQQCPTSIQMGTSSIGNWASPTQLDSSFAIRNLNGSIDELAIYDAALTAQEVQEMYREGNPE